MLFYSLIIGLGFRLEHCNYKAGCFMYFVHISLMAQVFMLENWAILHIFKVMGAFGQLEQGGFGQLRKCENKLWNYLNLNSNIDKSLGIANI